VATTAVPHKSSEAGAAEFVDSDSRKFNYFRPQGRHATLYEDVTVDVQPDPKRYLMQDWIISSANGVPAYSETKTGIKSSDWHVFRDPNGEWERTHYIRQAATEKQVQLTIDTAKLRGSFHLVDEGWVRIIQNHLGASKHAEYGVGHLFMETQREGMSQMINNAILVNSSDKLRYAQDLALYLMEFHSQLPQLNEAAGKQTWLTDPAWQGVRDVVENVTNVLDWAEAVFAVNVIYEPIVGELFRSGFIMQFAAFHGDFVTPTLVSTADSDYERNLAYTTAMFSLFAADSAFGRENQKLMQEWLQQFLPRCLSAARTLQPIWSQPRVKAIRFDDALERAQERVQSILKSIQVELPGGLSL
jgi:propane monooxygenase small subunit